MAQPPRLYEVAMIILKTADSASESGHTEAEVIAANWDTLGPMLRTAVDIYQGKRSHDN